MADEDIGGAQDIGDPPLGAGLFAPAQEPPDVAVRNVATDVLAPGHGAAMLPDHARKELDAANRRSTSTGAGLRTARTGRPFRKRKLEALQNSLGQDPEVPRDLHVRVAGTVPGDGFVSSATGPTTHSGDLCDLAGAVAPTPLKLEGLVDGLNRRRN